MVKDEEEQANEQQANAAPKPERLSLWQWLKQNDITVLILVAVLTVVITRVATHVDEKVVQPATHRILRVAPNEQPGGWKLAIEFFLILAAIYVIVEYIIRPAAPISHYILPPAVVDVKTAASTAASPENATAKKETSWADTFRPPPEAPKKKVVESEWW